MANRGLISYCWYNPQPMRNDHSIAGTTILQTTLEDANNTQFFIDGKTNPVVKVGRWTLRRFGVQHHRQSVAMKGKVGLLSLRLSDHFALVVGCINNNWLNLWKKKKKDAYKVFTGISPPLWMANRSFPSAAHEKADANVNVSSLRSSSGTNQKPPQNLTNFLKAGPPPPLRLF